MNKFITQLPQELRERLKIDIPLAELTTFKVGGPADFYFEPESVDEIAMLYRFAYENSIDVTVLGNGSNVVVADAGIRGLVIGLRHNFSELEFLGLKELPINHAQCRSLKRFAENFPNTPLYCDFGADPVFLRAQAGAKLADTSRAACASGLTGLEFACGIPGSVGGAVYMNAGAYGNSIEDVVVLTKSMDIAGNIYWKIGSEHDFAYRHSCFSAAGQIVLETFFALRSGIPGDIDERCADYTSRRQSSQPLELPSAGSMFKRPRGYFAGKLISDAGLKGHQVGGAAVSEKHAGFVVNLGMAKATDIKILVKEIQMTVFRQFGVQLEPEVRFIGDWDK